MEKYHSIIISPLFSLITTVLFISLLLHTSQAQVNYFKECAGTSSEMSASQDSEEQYHRLQSRYSGCTYIEGNLEIVKVEDPNYDLSFLSNITEVTGYLLISNVYVDILPLDNLKIIHGRTLYKEEFAMFMKYNYMLSKREIGLKQINLRNLREIVNGAIKIENNRYLCYLHTIDFDDIVNEETVALNQINITNDCGECHSECDPAGCWGPDLEDCQQLTRIICSEQCDHRCNGESPRDCCHRECAGGCSGPTEDDCIGCLRFNDDGVCVSRCPPKEIYNKETYTNEPNPDFRYSLGVRCVSECPDPYLAEDEGCVKMCAYGKMAVDGQCVDCEGPCPKTCTVTDVLSSQNIGELENCTFIQGNIDISELGLTGDNFFNITPMDVSQLQVLITVTEISGYLNVASNNENLTNLDFLSNLRSIWGQNQHNDMRALVIAPNFQLKSLGLVSLEVVKSGDISVVMNPELCYITDTTLQSLISSSDQTVIVVSNKDASSCESEGLLCDDECDTSDGMGCWGPGPGMCVQCAHYKLDDLCVARCHPDDGNYESAPGICEYCDMECDGGCSGSGSDNCTTCLHYADGPFCVAKCPVTKYSDESDLCLSCMDVCREGECTGPGEFKGEGGCTDCYLVVDYENGTNVCLRDDDVCPTHFYYTLEQDEFIAFMKTKVCKQCDEECISCTAAGPFRCDGCVDYMSDNKCVTECQYDRYPDDNNQCLQCDYECSNGCTGGNSYQCNSCRNYYYTLGPDLVDCVSTCPDEYPYREYSDIECLNNCTNNTYSDERFTCHDCHEQCLDGCYSEGRLGCYQCLNVKYQNECLEKCPQNYQANEKGICVAVTSGLTIGVIVGLLVLMLIVIAVFLAIYIRRKNQKKPDRLDGLPLDYIGGETQPLTPTGAAPNEATLRIIMVTQLEKGGILGSGAFGTVYKGIWLPEEIEEEVRIPVAIKVLHEGSAQAKKELLEEAYIMATVDHPCLVRLLAVCMCDEMMLVTQLMPHGSLLDYIRKNKVKIGSQALLNWCRQIAMGMSYLEEKRLVHRDLAARNVLVQTPTQVKITDFGLARILDIHEDEYTAAGGKMPIKWLALESITYRKFTHQSDVWSYGVTVWELMTFGAKPYDGVTARDVPDLLQKGERLPQPPICTIDIYLLMLKCWMSDPDCRPVFPELIEEFGKMARDPTRYIVIEKRSIAVRKSRSGEAHISPPPPYPSVNVTDNSAGSQKPPLPPTNADGLIDAEDYLQPQLRPKEQYASMDGSYNQEPTPSNPTNSRYCEDLTTPNLFDETDGTNEVFEYPNNNQYQSLDKTPSAEYINDDKPEYVPPSPPQPAVTNPEYLTYGDESDQDTEHDYVNNPRGKVIVNLGGVDNNSRESMV